MEKEIPPWWTQRQGGLWMPPCQRGRKTSGYENTTPGILWSADFRLEAQEINSHNVGDVSKILPHVLRPLETVKKPVDSRCHSVMAVVWNPNLYLRNLTPRIRPALDLLKSALLALPPGKEAADVEHILDLGCGPGE